MEGNTPSISYEISECRKFRTPRRDHRTINLFEGRLIPDLLLPGGCHIMCMIERVFLWLRLSYPYPAQHITTAGEDLDGVQYVDRDRSDVSEELGSISSTASAGCIGAEGHAVQRQTPMNNNNANYY